jgi:V/A-type H+/Na+-transporting ATPase subunit K
MKRRILFVALTVLGTALTAGLGGLLLWQGPILAQGAATGAAVAIDPAVLRWGYMAAALVTGLSALAAAYAVATVGSAAVGALTEKPELFGRLLILVGLAEGIAIYGIIISVLILNRLT